MALSEKFKKKMEKRKKAVSSKGGGSKGLIFFKDGKTRIRILNCGDDSDFGVEVTLFYLGKEINNVVSPATFGEPCAIMDRYNELKKGDDDDKELADTFKPRRRFYAPAIKFKDDKGKDYDDQVGAALAPLTNGCYTDMIDLMLDDENGDFTDPKNGYDVKIIKEGTGLETTYGVTPCKPTKLPKQFLKKTFDPEEMVKAMIPSFEETESMIAEFLGEGKKKKKKSSKEDRLAEKKALAKKKKKKKVSDA